MGFAIRQAVWNGLEMGERVVECISPTLMKERLRLGKSNGVSLSFIHAPTQNSDTTATDQF